VFLTGWLVEDKFILIKQNYVSGPMFLCKLRSVCCFKIQSIWNKSHTVDTTSVLCQELWTLNSNPFKKWRVYLCYHYEVVLKQSSFLSRTRPMRKNSTEENLYFPWCVINTHTYITLNILLYLWILCHKEIPEDTFWEQPLSPKLPNINQELRQQKLL
jgi:hypothetical protein